MKKKLSVVMAVLCLLVVANWVYGRILSSDLEKKLSDKIAQSNWGYLITYDRLKVNPLLSSLKLHGVVLENKNGTIHSKSKLVTIDMPYSEAIRLLEDDTFEEIRSFKIEAEGVVFFNETKETEFVTAKRLFVDFDGHLTKEEFENLDKHFPLEEQEVFLEAQKLRFIESPFVKLIGEENKEKDLFTTIDRVSSKVHFDPKKKEIELEKLEVDSKLFHHASDALIRYEGDGMKKMKPHWASSSIWFELNKRGVKWGDPSTTGEYRLKEFFIDTEGEYSLSGKGQKMVHSNETHVRLKGLKLGYEGNQKKKVQAQSKMLGVDMSELEVALFEFNSSMKDNVLKIRNTELECSYLDASFEASVEIDQNRTEKSQIESAKLVVSNISPKLEKAIGTLELLIGQDLPRKGKNVVLELSGSLFKPDIKGVKY